MEEYAAKKKNKKSEKTKKKVSPKKDPDRKPDYDEKEVPKVLKGPVNRDGPVVVMRKNYDAPIVPGPLLDGLGPHGRGMGPGGGRGPCMVPPEPIVESPAGVPMMLLECPQCGQQAPFEFKLPEGIPLNKLMLQCHDCGEKIAFGSIMNRGSGLYAVDLGE